MEYQEISLELEGPVATITLNRPAALNAITVRMLEELIDAFERFSFDPAIRVVVLTGEGRAFSSGVDLKSLNGQPLEGGAVGDLLDIPARRLIGLIEGCHPVVIAAVNGFCFTGALEIVLATDLAVVAEDAVLGDTHAKFGLRPTWGMSQRLPQSVGLRRARWLSYTSRTFTGRQAYDWGLAAEVCARADLGSVVGGLIETLLANSDGSIRAYKDLYRVAQRESIDRGIAYEEATSYEIGDTEQRVSKFR